MDITLTVITLSIVFVNLSFQVAAITNYERSMTYADGIGINSEDIPYVLFVKLLVLGIGVYFGTTNMFLVAGLAMVTFSEYITFFKGRYSPCRKPVHDILVLGFVVLCLGLYVAYLRHLYPQIL